MSSRLSPVQAEQPLRLHYLDGLRGLAALYVVCHHACMEIDALRGWLPERWHRLIPWASNGQIAVQCFIVLSGYCLALPVARAGNLKGSWIDFIKRRAHRILPPYYAAIILSLAVDFFVPGMHTPQGLLWDSTYPVLTPGVLISHALLFQDLRNIWLGRIDYPLWTLSQEWQIYFAFVLLLLPLWHRGGIIASVGFALLVSLALNYFPGHSFSYACPVFLFLFSVGMFAAAMTFPGRSPWLAAARDRLPWGWLTAVCWTVYVTVMVRHLDVDFFLSLPFALLAAPAVFCTLIYCTNSARLHQRHNFLLRFCEWEPVVILGTFSYSLYLVHAPVLSLSALALHRYGVVGELALMVEGFIAVPTAVAVAYGFHLVAERPFMRGHPKNLPRAEKAAILDTAP